MKMAGEKIFCIYSFPLFSLPLPVLFMKDGLKLCRAGWSCAALAKSNGVLSRACPSRLAADIREAPSRKNGTQFAAARAWRREIIRHGHDCAPRKGEAVRPSTGIRGSANPRNRSKANGSTMKRCAATAIAVDTQVPCLSAVGQRSSHEDQSRSSQRADQPAPPS